MHHREQQKGNWFLPGLVAIGMGTFFAFELGFLPLKVETPETGSLVDESPPLPGGDAVTEYDPASPFADQSPAPIEVASIPEQFEPNFESLPQGQSQKFEFGQTELELPSGLVEPHNSGGPPAGSTSANTLPAEIPPRGSAVGEYPFEENPFAANTVPGAGSEPTAAAPFEDPFDTAAFAQTAEAASMSAQNAVERKTGFPSAASPPQGAMSEPAPMPDTASTGQATPSVLNTSFSATPQATLAKPAALNDAPHPAPASSLTESDASREVRARVSQIDLLISEGDYLTAHAELSKIYWHFPGERSQIFDRIEKTARDIYAARQPNYVEPYVVKPGDQLRLIARGYKVPWQYVAYLNGVSERGIQPGQKLKVNRGPFSAVIDLSDFEMTIHAHGYYVHRYPVGIGRQGTTPLGEFEVLQKLENPTYYDPDGNVVDGDDPQNPLGEHWIDIGDGYGIHGTIDEDSIGQARSRGCVRMKNKHVAEVYNLLGVGSTVMIRR